MRRLRRPWLILTLIALAVCFIGWTQWGWRYWPRVETFAADPQSTADRPFAIVFETAPAAASKLDEAMQRPIVTLLAKAQPSISGDARDYTSLSIYWWPNPLTGLPWVQRDGQRNPAAADYDAPHLRRMVSTVRTLSAAARADADERALQWLRAWLVTPATRMNPHLTFAQMMPGIAAGGRQGIIEGLPIATDLLDALAWMDARHAIPAADRIAIRQWLGEYLSWLLQSRAGRSESTRANNHGTWYDVQIAALARSLGLAALEKETLARSRTRLATQFTPEGAQPHELSRARSWDYSLYNLKAWLHLEHLAQAHKEPLWPHGPAKALHYLRQHAATWPRQRASDDPVVALQRFEAKVETLNKRDE
jgi:hypothetical protein